MIDGLFWVISAVLFCSFLLIVVRGAPFVPTHRRDVDGLFSLPHMQHGGIFVDLGSGDGRLLAAASARGIQSVGYELNPVLVAISRWRLRKAVPRPQVIIADFWSAELPAGTGTVFVFLAGPFMSKLGRKLQREADRLGHSITLVSYGMEIPGRPSIDRHRGFVIYQFRPAT